MIFLQTELVPTQRMLKPRVEIESLPEDDEDIYLKIKFETYLQRPIQLAPLTYPEFYIDGDVQQLQLNRKKQLASPHARFITW